MSEGIKHDDNKLRYDLLPAEALEDVVRVYTYGAKTKYEPRNWQKGLSWCRIFAAIMRHMWAWLRGEDRDPESGLLHPAHAAWGCLALLEYHRTHTELDDRPVTVCHHEYIISALHYRKFDVCKHCRSLREVIKS